MSNLELIEQRRILGQDFKIYGDFDNPLFLAKDVAKWLDYNKDKVGQMLSNVDSEEKFTSPIYYSGQVRDMWFLTEDGLYEVLMQSRKPIAKTFKKQVKQILKEIRKNSLYKIKYKEEEFMDNLTNTLTRLTEELNECSQYYKITTSKKRQFTQYIKTRLGISKVNNEYLQVKARLFLILGVNKWEDIDFDTSKSLTILIDESVKIVKSERSYEQRTFWD